MNNNIEKQIRHLLFVIGLNYFEKKKPPLNNTWRAMFDQIDHPTLGCIRGLPSKSQKTVQFRNIKFAEIPGRWQDPILFSKRLSDDVFDATRFGPCCPQNAAGLNYDLGLVGNVKLEHDEILQSEFECLNLVITVPRIEKLIDSRALPVMVWYVL